MYLIGDGSLSSLLHQKYFRHNAISSTEHCITFLSLCVVIHTVSLCITSVYYMAEAADCCIHHSAKSVGKLATAEDFMVGRRYE